MFLDADGTIGVLVRGGCGGLVTQGEWEGGRIGV